MGKRRPTQILYKGETDIFRDWTVEEESEKRWLENKIKQSSQSNSKPKQSQKRKIDELSGAKSRAKVQNIAIEDEEEGPSAFDLLSSSLASEVKLNKATEAILKRIKMEQEAIDDEESQSEGSELDQEVEEEEENEDDADFQEDEIDEEEGIGENGVDEHEEQPADNSEEDGAEKATNEEAEEPSLEDDHLPQEKEDDFEVDESTLKDADVEPDREDDAFTKHYDTLIDDDATKQNTKQKLDFKTPFGHIFGNKELPPIHNSLDKYHVKPRIASKWQSVNTNTDANDNECSMTPLQNRLFSIMNDYADLLYTKRTYEDMHQIRSAYVLHALNHIAKTRDRILKHNAKLQSLKQQKKPLPEFRDMSFTRPKVLMVVPFKNDALKIVNILMDLLPQTYNNQIMYKKRFLKDFSLENDTPHKYKPDDFVKTFEGNIDDCFRIGINIGKKTMKLYSEFYNSDIILATPLGLRVTMGAPGERFHDHDFLSSIEVLIMDSCDVMFMQNWEHVVFILENLNRIPKRPHEYTDFSRIKEWYLNGWAKNYRQTMFFSAYLNVDLLNLWNKHCSNYHAKFKLRGEYEDGSITQVIPKIRQIFYRVKCDKLADIDDARFQYFVDEHLNRLRKSTLRHILVFVPSYFDYVRLRNHFKKHDVNFTKLSEYSSRGAAKKARREFFAGEFQFILYTERIHFFYRNRMRGIENIVFYGLPQNAHFYPELLNLIQDGQAGSCTVLFSKYDQFELERIVGSDRAARMLTSDKPTFMFC